MQHGNYSLEVASSRVQRVGCSRTQLCKLSRSFRDGRLFSSSCICTVFIDARTLGRPFCCRSLPSKRVSSQTLLALRPGSRPPSIQAVWALCHCHSVGQRPCTPQAPPADSDPEKSGDDDGAHGEENASNPQNPGSAGTPIEGRQIYRVGRPDDEERQRSACHDAASRVPVGVANTACKILPTIRLDGHKPIATPCRSLLGSIPQPVKSEDDRSLATPLDSAKRPRREETIVQCIELTHAHAQHLMLTSSPSSDVPGVERTPPCDKLRFGHLSLGFTLEHTRNLLCHPAHLAGFVEALCVCDPDSRSWFAENDAICPQYASPNILCFTDGTFTAPSKEVGNKLGWARAFFRDDTGTGSHRASCLGAVSGSVPEWGATPRSHPPISLSASLLQWERGSLRATFPDKASLLCRSSLLP